MLGPRLSLLLSFLLVAQGCTSWKQRPLTAGVTPAFSTERPVRITRSDRSEIVLEHPRIEGDSLIGDVGNPPQRVAVALRDVQRIEDRSVSLARTGGLVVGAGAVLFSVLIVATVLTVITLWSTRG